MEYTYRLNQLGYNSFFDDARSGYGASTSQVARVTAEHKGAYDIANTSGEFRAVVTGKQMLTAENRDDYPAVGDWVIIQETNDDTKIIEATLPRKTTLHKKYGGKYETQLIAANVEVAFIVESVDRDYSLNRFERYVVICKEGGVRPVIVINKIDLSSESVNSRLKQIRERFDDITVLATSTTSDTGLSALENYLEMGVTYCFLGSSGVGKSTLINKLLDNDSIVTQSIGEKTGRGKHTTTAREMYFTATGGIIIDNPGSREVGVAAANTGLKEVFVAIEDIASGCKFQDCKHLHEPGCAVMTALDTGIISIAQYENYQKLQKEVEHYELSAYDKRQKDKKFGKFIKSAKNELRRYAGD